MHKYSYRAVAPDGAEKAGMLVAASLPAAQTRLKKLNYVVVKIDEVGAPEGAQNTAAPVRRFGLFTPKLSAQQLGLFTRQLATLVSVMPMEEGLRTLVDQTENRTSHAILSAVHQRVLEGQRLSDALASQPASFSGLYCSMLSAGESSGALTPVLENLADLLDRQAETRNKLMVALAYPAALAGVALLVVIAMMTLVVPRLVEQFESIGQTLPFLTRAIIFISNALVSYGWLMALALVGGIVLLLHMLRSDGFRMRFDAFLLRLPLIGKMLRRVAAAQLARTLSIMLASGMPLVDGLRTTLKTVKNRRIRSAYEDVVVSIEEGGSISSALKRTGLAPPILVHMAASGEQSGKLSVLLERAAETLEREFDSFSSTVLGLLEPAIIVFMGGIVSLIVMAILLPILQLNVLAIG